MIDTRRGWKSYRAGSSDADLCDLVPSEVSWLIHEGSSSMFGRIKDDFITMFDEWCAIAQVSGESDDWGLEMSLIMTS